jgi:hypothetical protein
MQLIASASGKGWIIDCNGCAVIVVDGVVGIGDGLPGDKGGMSDDGIWFRF